MLDSISIAGFNQLLLILNQLNNDEFIANHELISNNSIGQHTRHILEFYLCLLNGAEQGEICYDHRKRDPSIANDLNVAITVCQYIQEHLPSTLQANKSIKMVSCFGDQIISTPSTVAREIVYLIEHDIHHFAIMGICLKNKYPHIKLPSNFGLAHSTVSYNNVLNHGH